MTILSTLRASLYPHQRETVKFLNKGNSCIIAHECGNGKTLPVIVHLLEERQSHPDHRTLVVVPACIVKKWREDLARYGLGTQVLVVSMETVATDSTGLDHTRDAGFVGVHRVVVDEIHLLGGEKTRRVLFGMLTPETIRIGLTGTPVMRGRKDLEMLAKFVGVTVDELRSERMLRKPPDVQLPPLHLTEWRRPKPDDAEAADPLLPTYSSIKKTFVQRAVSNRSKTELLVTLRSDRTQCPGHTIIFTYLKDVNEKVVRGLRRAGIGDVMAIRGDTKDREAMYNRCKEDPVQTRKLVLYLPALRYYAAHICRRIASFLPRFATLVVQIQTASVGLNLQMFQSVIFMPGWCPMTRWQAVKRVHRIGQTKPVHAHLLYWDDGVDARMRERCAQKVRAINAILNEDHPMGSCAQKT